MLAASLTVKHLPSDAEARIAEFSELIATAISNVEAHADLAASRARLVAAGDDERRRVVRDLHDGAQQRLVHTVIMLKLARRALPPGTEPTSGLMSEALDHAERAMTALRELAHGIMPAVLTGGGLHAAVTTLSSRSPARRATARSSPPRSRFPAGRRTTGPPRRPGAERPARLSRLRSAASRR